MPRASVHTTRKLTATMRQALRRAADGETSRYLTEASDWTAQSYTRRALVDRGLLTEDNRITERGRAALSRDT